MISIGRANLRELGEMWQAADGLGQHGRVAATMAGSGALAGGIQMGTVADAFP